MSRPVVLQAWVREPSGRVQFICSSGKEGKERASVVLTTFNTCVCLSCVKADDCEHAAAARAFYDQHRAELTTGAHLIVSTAAETPQDYAA